MKKFIAGLLLVLTLLSIASCGGTATFPGTWKLTKADLNGTSVDISILQGEITLNADKTGVYKTLGIDLEATWEEIDSTTAKLSYLSLTGTPNEMELKIDGKTLVFTDPDTKMKYIYEK